MFLVVNNKKKRISGNEGVHRLAKLLCFIVLNLMLGVFCFFLHYDKLSAQFQKLFSLIQKNISTMAPRIAFSVFVTDMSLKLLIQKNNLLGLTF